MILKTEDAIRKIKEYNQDFLLCSRDTKALCMASLIYRTHDFEELIPIIFPGYKVLTWSRLKEAQYFGLVIDEKAKTLWQVNRGTGGENAAGKLISWLYDAAFVKSSNGMHTGFDMLSRYVSSEVSSFYTSEHCLISTGTSQGAAVSVGVAERAIGSVRTSAFVTFAPPPTGDIRYASYIRSLINIGVLSGRLYINPQDPVTSSILNSSLDQSENRRLV